MKKEYITKAVIVAAERIMNYTKCRGQYAQEKDIREIIKQELRLGKYKTVKLSAVFTDPD